MFRNVAGFKKARKVCSNTNKRLLKGIKTERSFIGNIAIREVEARSNRKKLPMYVSTLPYEGLSVEDTQKIERYLFAVANRLYKNKELKQQEFSQKVLRNVLTHFALSEEALEIFKEHKEYGIEFIEFKEK
jgi:hypothetical protein